MKKRTKWAIVTLMAILLPFCGLFTEAVHAASVNLHFGSEQYEHRYDESFLIGVYIEADENIGNYEVVLSYDENYITYVSGAEAGGEGTVILRGNLNGDYKKYLISFRAIAGGETNIEVASANINTSNSERINVSVLPSAPINLTHNPEALLSSIKINGVELEEFDSNVFNYDIKIPYTEQLDIDAIGRNGVTTEVLSDNLSVGNNMVYIEAEGSGSSRNIYKLNVIMEEENVTEEKLPDSTNYEVASDEKADFSENSMNENGAVQIEDGPIDDGDFLLSLFNGKIRLNILQILIILLIISLALLVVLLILSFYTEKKKRKRRKRKKGRKRRKSTRSGSGKTSVPNIQEIKPRNKPVDISLKDRSLEERPLEEDEDFKLYGIEFICDDFDDDFDDEYEEPVIAIDDVSMLFRVATQNVSGLKEFIIQKLKGKITYREFYALNHVSIDIYKGEVVGIIGTNGSGKSTLLKIVSGALKPTGGKVIVDKSKVQLLTLGTGFDMELTAKENVYLNGAIIGYSKEFIDSVYDDIVAFAELEDFMEEKVKNFSSGMVSRLGFAIATIGDAPEILILDEVLSVGDEFFRKKSLARVKEMIHGGSTVLLVSHSMQTILDNCSRVAWIEKGVLKMYGEPNKVCKAYQDMGNTET